MLDAIDELAPPEDRPGVYVALSGRPNEVIATDKFDRSGLRLLKVEPAAADGAAGSIVFFAPTEALARLRTKVERFRDEDTPKGRPKNADLVQSIGSLDRANMKALWRGPAEAYPAQDQGLIPWEVWVIRDEAEEFARAAGAVGVHVAEDRLYFPEQTVLRVTATRPQLRSLVVASGAVTALAKPATTADFFDSLPVDAQPAWTQDLLGRTDFAAGDAARTYVTLLDTGVTLGHPLLQGALDRADRHAADPAWGVEDTHGHGTGMAGLALFGDLTNKLESPERVRVRHRLESAKVIPDAGVNPHHLLGTVTRRAVDAVEAAAERRRVFTLASSTRDDHPHDGAPTSWSVELDQLAAGTSGAVRAPRLIVTAAGNVKSERHDSRDYHRVCDGPDEELESPGQAWNAVTVGAYTDKTTLGPGIAGAPLAPAGDLSPFSKTASWNSVWPIKPDIVLEGGNLVLDRHPPAMACQDLSLLTTHHDPAARHFSTFEATSAATALAARMAARIWRKYPDAWPETIRALLVSSARWTRPMVRHLPANPTKTDYEALFRRYGYGVPNLKRAGRSAIDAVTLIVEDTLTPYTHSATRGSPPVHNHIKLHALPWPVDRLREMGAQEVRLRVTLSTFIEPNPAEASRGRKLQYGSHGLRFKLNRPDESAAEFEARINAAATEEDRPAPMRAGEDDGWRFGARRRDVGSLHIDELTCRASDLARRNILAVHPVGGWWKTALRTGEVPRVARYALLVEIDAQGTEIDLYAEIQTAIAAQVRAAVLAAAVAV